MLIVLTPRRAKWIAAHVDERIADRELEDGDDFGWAKPLVEDGFAALQRGETITLEERKARNIARLAALKR